MSELPVNRALSFHRKVTRRTMTRSTISTRLTRSQFWWTLIFGLVCGFQYVAGYSKSLAQERTPLTDGRIVDFQRDIVPVFENHCLECHGPEDAKNDFRIDDPDSVFSYVEAEDVESSSLYVDYILSDDPDYMMPPPSHGGPLSASEISLIKVWIEEGADWPEGVTMGDGSDAKAPEEDTPKAARSLFGRVWGFQGFFHPATVHFPIALFTFGAFFVVLGWKWPELGKQIPLACLLLGAPSAIGATLMGWAFATEQGYGSWTKVDFDSEVFWHRWSGVIVTVLAVVFALIALKAWKTKDAKLDKIWRVGLLVIAGIVGLVGHQGGELSYGKDFYPKAFRILFGTEGEEQGGEVAEPEVVEDEEAVAQILIPLTDRSKGTL